MLFIRHLLDAQAVVVRFHFMLSFPSSSLAPSSFLNLTIQILHAPPSICLFTQKPVITLPSGNVHVPSPFFATARL